MLTVCKIRVKPFLKVLIPHIIVVSMLVFGIAFLIKTAKADDFIYSWETKDHVMAFTDNRGMIPRAYRNQIMIKAKGTLRDYEKATLMAPENTIVQPPKQNCCTLLADSTNPSVVNIKRTFTLFRNCAGAKLSGSFVFFVLCLK